MQFTRALSIVFAGAAILLPGCSFLTTAERDYLSNEDVLGTAAMASGYLVDPGLFRLTGLDVREDSISFQYSGVAHPGDHAWVVRFSEKTTEQNPIALADVYSLLPLLGEGRNGFAIVDEGARAADGLSARFVRYRFESPIRDGAGKPLPAHGIVASLRVEGGGTPLVYHLKLDNHGDREDVGWEDLEPLVEGTRGE